MNSYNSLITKLEGKVYSEDLEVYRKIILRWILGKLFRKVWTGYVWHRIGPNGGLF
jgi:hypothetical protein